MYECEVDDDKIMLINSTTHSMQDKIRFYGDPRAQMDNGAKCSVTNKISILRNIKYFDKSNPAPVRMRGATSKDIVIPEAEGKLRVQADVPEGFIDVHVFYSPFFTSTLLSDRDILFATPFLLIIKGK